MTIAEVIERLLRAGLDATAQRPRGPEETLPSSGFEVGTGFDLGAFPEGGTPLSLDDAELRRHAYILGATGSGKTNLLLQLVERDVEAGRSVALVDMRGDLVDRVARRLLGRGVPESRFCLIDLRDDRESTPLNPLSGAGDAHARAYHVLDVLRHQAESWGVQLDETLRNALVALAETHLTLADVEPLLMDDDARARVLGGVGDPYVRSFFARYGELSRERRAVWALPVLNKVTPLLAIPRIRAMLSARSGLDLRCVLDTPGSILLVALAVDRFHAASRLVGGLFVSSAQTAVMARAGAPERGRNPVTLYVDEFETMAGEAFEALLAEGRRFGVSLVLSHQNLLQIPAKLKACLLANAHVQLYFQTGASDAAEIAREVSGDLPSAALRKRLIDFQVGEALLVRRGSPTRIVRTRLIEDPPGVASLDRLRSRAWLPLSPAPPLAWSEAAAPIGDHAWEVRDEDEPR